MADTNSTPQKTPDKHLRRFLLILIPIIIVIAVITGMVLNTYNGSCDPLDYNGTCTESKGNPTILDASPLEGEPQGGNAIEINGAHFGPGVRVWFGDKEATKLTVINNIRIKAVVPPGGHPHLVDVKVARGDGPQDVLEGGYRYEEDTVVHTLTPNTGPASGGTIVTIKGDGFAPETRVSFGGEKSQVPEYVDQHTIRAKTPPHELGVIVVNVRTGEDELTIDEGFTYQ